MSKYIGDVSAYAYAVSKGYTGTEEEFAELMASYADVGQTAVDAKDAAVAAKTAAQTAATTATNKATEATTAATTATTKAGEASTSASTATSAKDTAVSASQTATTKATEATTAAATATSAKTDAVAANTAAQSAKTAAQTAQTGAETAAASVSASAEQIATNAADISQLKSDFADMQSDGVVPSAEQILSDKGVTDSVPYHYRKTGGDGADRLYDKIVGGSLAVNQLVQNGNFANAVASFWQIGAWKSYSTSDNTLHLVSKENQSNYINISQSIGIVAGHKYLFSADVKASKASSFGGSFGSSSGGGTFINIQYPADTWTHVSAICRITTFTDNNLYIRPKSTSDEEEVDVYLKNINAFDLTLMLGSTIADYVYTLESGTAGAGVAWLKSHFPRIFNAGYVPYNAGELVSVQASAHKMVGFNQWDEEWEVGGISTNTGANESANDIIRSKNYIDVLPNTAYYCTYANGTAVYDCFFYDSDKNFISHAVTNNGLVTTPSNCAFMRFRCKASYGTTYNNDICINISSSRNGEYEPYEEHSYPLDDSLELRGLPKLDADNNLVYDGDVYESDGKVTRKYGIVDLGTLTWTTRFSGFITNSIRNLTKIVSSNGETPNIMCKAYPTLAYGSISGVDKFISMIRAADNYTHNGYIIVRDSGYTDAATFKTAMSGVYLVYELATPTTETAQPFTNPQVVDASGTEEYVSTGIVPVGHNSFYPENLRAKVEQLPWNFASLIAPTEATFTATRNYTTGSLFIVDNVLYKATSNIANGGTITPNTNCTATTLAEIISALA